MDAAHLLPIQERTSTFACIILHVCKELNSSIPMILSKACLCVFLCTLSICTVYYFASFCISLLKPLLRAWFFSGLLIMSSILCCAFLCLFVLMYDIGIKFEMIWYMISYYTKPCMLLVSLFVGYVGRTHTVIPLLLWNNFPQNIRKVFTIHNLYKI